MKVTYLDNQELDIGPFDKPITRELIKKIEINRIDLVFMFAEPHRLQEFKDNLSTWIDKLGLPVII